MVLDAESAKASMLPNPPGKQTELIEKVDGIQQGYHFIAQMDEDYLVVGSNIEESLQSKIIKGEYVDFSKLLSKDKILSEEDGRLELIIRNGKTFWVPVNEGLTISNFSRWEQAFRVFSNIYTRAHPYKSSELIQYNHIIHSISSQYV